MNVLFYLRLFSKIQNILEHMHTKECLVIKSCVKLFGTLQTIAHQAPLSMGFSGQEYWSGLPFPPPGDLPNPGIELASPVSTAFAGGFFTI